MNGSQQKPKCVVLSCIGGSQGDLGVVRTLGREGVEIVLISEYRDNIARHSRYVKEFYCTGKPFDNRAETLRFLIQYARRQPVKPVLFPTADPDLMMLSDLREELQEHYRLFVSRKEIVDNFVDKARFFHFAMKHEFPVPATTIPKNSAEVERFSQSTTFPVIIKPMIPQAWTQEKIRHIVDGKKAVTAVSSEELLDYYTRIAEHDKHLVIQEYIPGRDDHLYSLHIYMDKSSRPMGYFTGQKIRTYPTYAGIGCFVISKYVPEIVEAGIRMLSSVNYTGLALMQFKRDPRDDKYKLIEVNPRASSWNMLAYECGVNLPYIAYRDAIGERVERPGRQKEGIKYVFMKNDFMAFMDYRRHGEWTWASWLGSLRGKKVFQYYARDDLRPFVMRLKGSLGKLTDRVPTRLGGKRKRKDRKLAPL